MIIAVTPAGRAMLAAALDHLSAARSKLLAQGAPPKVQKKVLTNAALEFFKRMGSHDRAQLQAARPRDIFLTAVRAWRLQKPGIMRNVSAALLALQVAQVVPSIEAAQAQLRA